MVTPGKKGEDMRKEYKLEDWGRDSEYENLLKGSRCCQCDTRKPTYFWSEHPRCADVECPNGGSVKVMRASEDLRAMAEAERNNKCMKSFKEQPSAPNYLAVCCKCENKNLEQEVSYSGS